MKRVLTVFPRQTYESGPGGVVKTYLHDVELCEVLGQAKTLRIHVVGNSQSDAQARAIVARYVAKAGEQETRLDELTRDRKTLEVDRARVRADLEAAIRALSLDQKAGHR